jgi:anti-sigma factor RsiW
MSHLSTEQLEDLLAGEGGEAREHLDDCEACRQRLAEAELLRNRLRGAFEGVRPPADLASRILSESRNPPAPKRPVAKALRSGLAAAAVILLGVTLWMHLEANGSAPSDLLAMHEGNVARVNGFHLAGEPERIVALLLEEVGRAPASPRLCQCSSLEGGRQGRLLGQSVGTYLVRTPKGEVSVVIAVARPVALGLEPMTHASGADLWCLHCDSCHIVAMRSDSATYVTVGDMSDEQLADVLLRVVPARNTPASWREDCPFCGRRRQALALAH